VFSFTRPCRVCDHHYGRRSPAEICVADSRRDRTNTIGAVAAAIFAIGWTRIGELGNLAGYAD
jgi:hypothetical protein